MWHGKGRPRLTSPSLLLLVACCLLGKDLCAGLSAGLPLSALPSTLALALSEARIVLPSPSPGGDAAVAGEVKGWHIHDPAFRRTFLADYWQKRPLLVRGALGVDSQGVPVVPVCGSDLLELCQEEDVESRIVNQGKKSYGPFTPSQVYGAPLLPLTDGTLPLSRT